MGRWVGGVVPSRACSLHAVRVSLATKTRVEPVEGARSVLTGMGRGGRPVPGASRFSRPRCLFILFVSFALALEFFLTFWRLDLNLKKARAKAHAYGPTSGFHTGRGSEGDDLL